MKSVMALVLPLALMGTALHAAQTGGAGKPAAEQYRAECGSCHMAYPAGLLPARSWQKLLDNLANHFGDNAELSGEARARITAYLLAEGDKPQDRHMTRLIASAPPGETPLRITGLPYFKHEHREIPQRYIKDNPQVHSLSNCNACHTRAEQGSFREREISIPGLGRWEDD